MSNSIFNQKEKNSSFDDDDDGGFDEGGERTKKMRNRIITSCDRCRRLHAKCDRGKPSCGRCLKAKSSCAYRSANQKDSIHKKRVTVFRWDEYQPSCKKFKQQSTSLSLDSTSGDLGSTSNLPNTFFQKENNKITNIEKEPLVSLKSHVHKNITIPHQKSSKAYIIRTIGNGVIENKFINRDLSSKEVGFNNSSQTQQDIGNLALSEYSNSNKSEPNLIKTRETLDENGIDLHVSDSSNNETIESNEKNRYLATSENIFDTIFSTESITVNTILNNWLCMSNIKDSVTEVYSVGFQIIEKNKIEQILDNLCASLLSKRNSIGHKNSSINEYEHIADSVYELDYDKDFFNIVFLSMFIYGLHREGYSKYSRHIHENYFIKLTHCHLLQHNLLDNNYNPETEEEKILLIRRRLNFLNSLNLESLFLITEGDAKAQKEVEDYLRMIQLLLQSIVDFTHVTEENESLSIKELRSQIEPQVVGNKFLYKILGACSRGYPFEKLCDLMLLLFTHMKKFMPKNSLSLVSSLLKTLQNQHGEYYCDTYLRISEFMIKTSLELEEKQSLKSLKHMFSLNYILLRWSQIKCREYVVSLKIKEFFAKNRTEEETFKNSISVHTFKVFEIYDEIIQWYSKNDIYTNGTRSLSTTFLGVLKDTCQHYVMMYENKNGIIPCEEETLKSATEKYSNKFILDSIQLSARAIHNNRKTFRMFETHPEAFYSRGIKILLDNRRISISNK